MERSSASGCVRRRRLFATAAATLIAVSLTACSVVKLSPPPSASSSGPVGTATTSSNPTASAPTGPLTSLAPVAAGQWTGINWIAIPGGHAPAIPASTGAEDGSGGAIEGWSKGYVDFVWDAHKRTVTPWSSTDGLTWRQGAKLDLSPWTDYLKTYDAANDGSDPQHHDDCSFDVGNFQQGPATLLVQGFVGCNAQSLCAGGYDNNHITWTSSDGLSWTPGKLPYAAPDHEDTISGGSSGFIGMDYSTSRPTIWVSSDGQTWRRGVLPAETQTAGSSVGYPVSFSGGLVLPGVVTVNSGHRTSDGDCGGNEDTSRYQGALWWSPDGISWTRDNLTGASPTTGSVDMNVARLDDHTIAAEQTTSDGEIEWVSTDGKTWTRLESNPVEIHHSILSGVVVDLNNAGALVGADRCVIWNDTSVGRDFSVFDARFDLVTLNQTGDRPSWGQMALGPTGLLVTQDGSQLWIGVPTAG